MLTLTDSNQDEFLKEVLSLFATEAGQLVAQVKEAMGDLERGVGSQRQAECLQALHSGLTTLGGSAATAGLAEVEQLAYALLPMIEQFRVKGTLVSGHRLASLKDSVAAIEEAAGRLAEGGDGTILDLAGLLKQVAEAERSAEPSVAAGSVASSSGGTKTGLRLRPASKSPLEVLRELHKRQEASPGLSRHILDTVLKRAQESSQGAGISPDVKTIRSLLREIDATDEWFLTEIRAHLPDVLGTFARVKAGESTDEEAEKAFEDVTGLQAAAQKADAAAIMQFFQGLHLFLSITTRKRLEVSAERFQAVESRLEMILRLAQRWVQLGQQERSAIERCLVDAGLLSA